MIVVYYCGMINYMIIPDKIKQYIDFSGPNGCWIWTGAKTKAGYGNFLRKINGKQKQFYAHRYIYELKNGKIADGLFCCHVCDVRACCNPDHIFLGTAKDNTQDAINKGRLYTIFTKTNTTFDELVKEYKDNHHTITSLAKHYSVSSVSIIALFKKNNIKLNSTISPKRKRKYTQEQLKEAKELYATNRYTQQEVVTMLKLNIDRSYFSTLLRGDTK